MAKKTNAVLGGPAIKKFRRDHGIYQGSGIKDSAEQLAKKFKAHEGVTLEKLQRWLSSPLDVAAPSKAKKGQKGAGLDLDTLLAVKKFADQNGGADAVREALDTLDKLTK